CEGESVTYTVTSENEGAAPVYQWFINGNPAGGNTSVFTTSSLANGDIVSCQLTSSESCVTSATVMSNSIVTVVNNKVTPEVSITANGPTTVCQGTPVNFTASALNGGSAPTYQWLVNGTPVGSGETYSTSSLVTGDVVSCMLTSNASCVTTTTAASNQIAVTVNSAIIPQISIAITSGANSICEGTNVTFTATATHGGTTPVYQWKVNGNNVGTGATFAISTLKDNDVITCELTSSLECATQSTVVSNSIIMSVDKLIVANAGNDQTVTANYTTLSAVISTGTGTWSVVSGTGTFSSVNNPSANVSGLSQGQNIFKWTVQNGLCTSEDEVVINYTGSQGLTMSGPTEVEANYTYTFSVPALAGATYVWTVPDGAVIIFGENTNIIHVIFTAHSSGQVTCIRNSSETAVKTVTVKTTTPTGIAGAEGLMEVYPNPFVDATTLYLHNAGNRIIIQVTDLNGVLVKELITTESEVTISDDLTAGIYFVHIIDNANIQRKPVRLIKLK
ncbi:MAG TPA: T9SS type A sorting domain-containing protein, partial [Cytophagaceae bacterium]